MIPLIANAVKVEFSSLALREPSGTKHIREMSRNMGLVTHLSDAHKLPQRRSCPVSPSLTAPKPFLS